MTELSGDISLKDYQIRSSVISDTRLRLLAGVVASSTIGYVGYRRGSLSRSGFLGAILTGTLTNVRGGYGHSALLVAFFVSSSLLSRLPHRSRVRITDGADGAPNRDVWQVLANGGLSTAIAAVRTGRFPDLACAGALAAATGDTWATEIGSRYGGTPRNILTMQPIPTGMSGGVSLLGTLASIAGGAFIGAIASLVWSAKPNPNRNRRLSPVVACILSGATGSLVDSLVGATIQERRWCDRCQVETERRVHRCGLPTRLVGGVPGINNEIVNFIGTLAGMGVGLVLERWGRV